MRKILCVCAVLFCFICIIGCKKKNVTEKIEDNNKNVTSVESSVSQEDSSIQDINNQNEAMQPSELKLPNDSEIESELNLTKNERNTEVGLDDKASEKEIKKDSEESTVMNTSYTINSVSQESDEGDSETSTKGKEVANNAALEQLRKELTESFDAEKQQLLENQKKELTEQFNTQLEVKTKKYEEEKKAALEQLRKELTDNFNSDKQLSLESQKIELTEQYNKELEEKSTALEKEKTDALEKLKESYETEKKQALANKEEELNKTFEEKKASEIKEIEDSINKKYSDEFESKKTIFMDEVRTQLTSELEQSYKEKKDLEVNNIKAELTQKKTEEIKELKIQLKKEAIEANHSYTERFKIAALYIFIIVLVIIAIVTVISQVVRRKRDIERKILADKEEKKQLELQKKREKEAHADRENLKKLLIIKHYEYLKSTKGDKASAIEYFMEHEGKENYSIEYEAFQKAVELYEHPNKG